jgi:hypothetical protein
MEYMKTTMPPPVKDIVTPLLPGHQASFCSWRVNFCIIKEKIWTQMNADNQDK